MTDNQTANSSGRYIETSGSQRDTVARASVSLPVTTTPGADAQIPSTRLPTHFA